MSGNKAKGEFNTSSMTSMPATQMATERDPEFYFDDKLVVIQVENTLFKVHKYHLIKSETFSDMFKMPKAPAEGFEEGGSPEHPIVLSAVSAPDFRALLKVLYAEDFSHKKLEREPELIVPAFRLAHMWNFSDLRTYLLPLARDAQGSVDKIVLARELGIQEWLAPAHVELCKRAESLTKEEVKKLGIDSTVLVVRLREKFRLSQGGPNGAGSYCTGCLNSRFLGYFGSTYCSGCSGHMTGQYYRVPRVSPSTPPPSSSEELETQVQNWVEGGCVSE